MKENYTVSFTKNDVAQARLVKAENAEQALAYFAEIEPTATIHGASLDQCNLERRGCPVEIVPDGWQPAAPEQEQAAEQEQDTTADILRKAADIIEARKDRSAWDRGVNAYALELLDNLAELAPDDLSSRAIIRAALLNGASDWQQYSYGGCALIYDCDIAERLCTPSELKRCRGGEWNLSSKENWLDVQARALRRAGFRVEAAIKEVRA